MRDEGLQGLTAQINRSMRRVFGIAVAMSLLFIAVALRAWGAAEVRADGIRVSALTCAGAGWLFFSTALFSWFGLSLRDDVQERNNVAALVAICGAIIASAVIYAGGSVGEGPSYLNNVFSIGLAAAGFFVLWLLLELGGRISSSITEERDIASGIRMSGFLVAVALVLGRAAAGDWHSESATVHDLFRDGWPALAICAVAVLVERWARPSRSRPFPKWTNCGLLPAFFYLVVAALWLWHRGPWEGMPR